MSADGCKYADRCQFQHQASDEAMQGRRFFCSAEGHWSNTCPIKLARKAEAKPDSTSVTAKDAKAKGKGKANEKGSPVPKAKAIGIVEPEEDTGPPTLPSGEDPTTKASGVCAGATGTNCPMLPAKCSHQVIEPASS